MDEGVCVSSYMDALVIYLFYSHPPELTPRFESAA
jgi:hypothetical protein